MARRYDNHPVLTAIPALYGKPYVDAAKDTWRLFKDRGIDAIINDSLVNMSTPVPTFFSVTFELTGGWQL